MCNKFFKRNTRLSWDPHWKKKIHEFVRNVQKTDRVTLCMYTRYYAENIPGLTIKKYQLNFNRRVMSSTGQLIDNAEAG